MNGPCQEPGCDNDGGFGLGGMYCEEHGHAGGRGMTAASFRRTWARLHDAGERGEEPDR